jgi:hypothetical protein
MNLESRGRRILLNQIFIMKALHEILLHTAGGHGELLSDLAAETKATEEHVRAAEVAHGILDAKPAEEIEQPPIK